MPALAAFAIAAAPAVAAGVGVYSLVEQSKARKEAASAVERAAALRREELEYQEKQAGEYWEITEKQMELQAQASQIETLADVLGRTSQPAEPRIVTLPAAKKYSPIENINRAIGNLLKVG